jgi:hypothetical protein
MQRSTTPVNSPLAIAPMSVLSMPANCGRRAVQIVHRTRWGDPQTADPNACQDRTPEIRPSSAHKQFALRRERGPHFRRHARRNNWRESGDASRRRRAP